MSRRPRCPPAQLEQVRILDGRCKADQVTPEEYQQERAKIISGT